MKGLEYKPRGGQHWVLVNKKTGKVASSNKWLLSLAAVAVLNGESAGLPSLLPLKKAKRLLLSNSLVLKKSREAISKPVRGQLRAQAKLMIPALAVQFEQQLRSNKSPRRIEFCKWITNALYDCKSKPFKIAAARRYDELLATPHTWRWWMNQLEKKCRVKYCVTTIFYAPDGII